ncbi:MAG: spermine synthase [Desulfobacterota bacterium]|nr:spermine synthase [Thermodesulfobacteriota bacterium]
MFPLHLSLLIMGASGIVAQILLLRELLVSFMGNELTLGIILANWLLLEALGSFLLGKTAEWTGKKLEVYVFLQIFFSVALPFSIYLCRTFKNMVGLTPGEGLGILPILYASFLILLPVSMSHGALFTYGSKLHSQAEGGQAPSIGRVYLLETIGSILGGLLITFWLLRHFQSFEIAFMVSLTNAFISAYLLWPLGRPWCRTRNLSFLLCLVYTLLFLVLILSPLSDRIHRFSLQQQWKGLTVLHNENSIYGNLTVTRRGEQYTFFTDGVPSITTPVPDLASIEDLVHFSMLFHERPSSILVLSGGAGGVIHEILKYAVSKVDYVELDPLLLTLIKKYPTPLTQSELSDPRVKIHHTDGRLFLQRTSERYDLILIGIPSPQELQTNRLFSEEFFDMARKRMYPGGLLVFTLPGSLTYISPELKRFNGCLLDTLKRVFRHVRVIPGETNLYFGSDAETLPRLTPQDLMKRLEERKVRTHLFTRNYVEYRLHERWQRWYEESMKREGVHINSDFKPLAVFFSLSYWTALFSPPLSPWFAWFSGLNLTWFLWLLVPLTSILVLLFFKKPALSGYAVPYAILTSGVTDMILDLALLFTFQTLFGYLYHQIGLLITVFMVGVALGSFGVTRSLDRIRNAVGLFLASELALILFSALLPTILTFPARHLEKPAISVTLFGMFLLMSLFCGTLVGFQFPLSAKLYLGTRSGKGKVAHTAGLLYGADLVGGFFGGLLGGVLLLPVLGLHRTCLALALLKASSLLLLLMFRRIQKSPP